jgi:ribosomal-protein-alanine N-acetyltransferase
VIASPLHPVALDCRHLDAVRALAARCFTRAWGSQDFAYFLSHECRQAWGIFSADSPPRLAAYFLGLLVQGELDVISVATEPLARRQGLAARLIRQACADPAVEKAFLEVDVGNTAAIALYRKLGFQPTGVRRGYYEGKSDAQLMAWVR